MAFSFFGILKGLSIQNEVDKTKQVTIQASSSISTNSNLTVTSAHTANRTLTLPDATDTLVGQATTDTLSNKTLDNTNTATLKSNHFTVQDPTDPTKQAVFDLSSLPTSTTQTIVVTTSAPVTTAGVQTLSNKTLDDTTTIRIKDTNFRIEGSTDATKSFTFDTANISTGVSANYALPAPGGGSLVSLQSTDILRNKSLVDNSTSIVDSTDNTKKILFNAGGTTSTSTTLTAAQTANRVLTLPDATDTLVGRATSDILTNKFLVDNSTVIQNNADSTKQLHFAANGTTSTTTLLQTSQTTGRTLTLPDANDTLVGKATTDTFTNKTIGDALTFTQIATPGNPASGSNKFYVKSDGNFYKLNSSGTETQIAGSSTTSTNQLKNYMAPLVTSNGTNTLDGTFESYTVTPTGWNVFPSIGTLTGGIPTGTPTFSGSSPNLNFFLDSPTTHGSGVNAGVLTVASGVGTTAAGNFFAAPAFFIDKTDAGKTLFWSFTYASGGQTGLVFAGNSSNTFGVAIWDVTNSSWLTNSGTFSMDQGTGIGKASGVVQANATTAQLRFCVYLSSSVGNNGAGCDFDDFFIGPQPSIPTFVGVRASGTSQTITTGIGSATILKHTTTTSDRGSLYNATNGTWTVPVTGMYRLTAQVSYSDNNSTGARQIMFQQTTTPGSLGTLTPIAEQYLNASALTCVPGEGGFIGQVTLSYTTSVIAGNFIAVSTSQSSGSTLNLRSEGMFNFIEIEKIG